MHRTWFALPAFVVLTVACSSSQAPTPVEITIELTAAKSLLVRHETSQVTATVTGADAAAVTYATNNSAVITISPTGLVTAVGPGTTQVLATINQTSKTINITVAEGALIGPAGGTLTAFGGLVELIVPAGALASAVALQAVKGEFPAPDPTVIVGADVTISPTVEFAQPATLKLIYSSSGVPSGVASNGLGLRRLNNGGWVDYAGSGISTGVVQATVSTSGTYTAGRLRPPACMNPADRAFDFWIGTWTITTGAPPLPAGNSTITLEPGGCAVLEHFTDLGGTIGRSITFRDANGKWHQTYVDNRGGRLLMSGPAGAGTMTLDTPSQGGTFERWSWVLNADGTVRQTAQVTTDGGSSFFPPSWNGLYTKVP